MPQVASLEARPALAELPRPIYLDYHATTPVDPRVAAVVMRCMTKTFGNASSVGHLVGERASATVDQARREVATLVGAEADSVVFTSGATEAINLAVSGFVRRRRREQYMQPVRIALPRTEHRAVLDTCLALEGQGEAELQWLP